MSPEPHTRASGAQIQWTELGRDFCPLMGETVMPIDYLDVVKEAFENIGPRNPLKKLSDSDKRLLVAFLDWYMFPANYEQAFSFLEEAASIASEAAALAGRIRSGVFKGDTARILAPFVVSFQDLPVQLQAFSTQLGTLLDQLVGKRGHKAKVQKNCILITASEFVRLKTTHHYDEHLAELLQTVSPRIDLNVQEDISGDSIRKKREHLKKHYPILHAEIVDRLRR